MQQERRELNGCSVSIRHLDSREMWRSEQQDVFELKRARLDIVEREGCELSVRIKHKDVTSSRVVSIFEL